MSDLISRQAAIDVLHGYLDGMLETDTICPQDLYNLFKLLPSVQECEDCVSRESLRKAMYHRAFETDGDTMWQSGCWVRYRAIEQVIKDAPSVIPKPKDNKVHLCDSCQYTYQSCPSHEDDAIFGDGFGNDNICCCNKYKPITPKPKMGRWIPVRTYWWKCSECGNEIYSETVADRREYQRFCSRCGAHMIEEGQDE